MRMTLIVDGYNIIGAWNSEFAGSYNLQESREKLIGILCDYAGYSGDRVILVFDAYGGENPKRSIEDVSGIEVVYTKSGEIADHYIERLVNELCRNATKQIEVRVATNDAIEQSVVLGRGAARISAAELKRLVDYERSQGRKRHTQTTKNSLDTTLPGDVLQKLEHMRRKM